MASPVHSTVPHMSEAFFTPGPNRSTRPHTGAQTMPPLAATHSGVPPQYQPHDSPLARSQGQMGQPQTASTSLGSSQSQNQHSRTRSLSSASMMARGLVINPTQTDPFRPSHSADQTTLPGQAQPSTLHGQRWPDTPTNPDHTLNSGSDGLSGSPTLQTPSTGQGSFPSIDNLGMAAHGLQHGSAHYRSQTDPSQPRTYVTQHYRTAIAGGSQNPSMSSIASGMTYGADSGMAVDQSHNPLSSQSGPIPIESQSHDHGRGKGKRPMPMMSPIQHAAVQSTGGDNIQSSTRASRGHNPLESPLIMASQMHSGTGTSSSGPTMSPTGAVPPATLPRYQGYRIPGPHYSQGEYANEPPSPYLLGMPTGPMTLPPTNNHPGTINPHSGNQADSYSAPSMPMLYSTPQSQRNIRTNVPCTPPSPVTSRAPGQMQSLQPGSGGQFKRRKLHHANVLRGYLW